ncbi:MAG: extracellular solute-binding protein [Spirochaetaceae bacterium]|jgi:raffinose/stachyose/melibiose transport system substrate-binding protein|nr:extracellular solute-binding protein [Spirochaetaceae bacterium]
MQQKRKIVGIILTALVAALAMTGFGCAKKDGSAGKTTISVLNYADMTVANTAADQKWTWDTFKANNTDINLVIEDLFNEPFHQKTEAYAASGNLPDVLYVWPSGRSTSLHQNKLLKDLGPLIRKEGLQNSYVPIAMDPSQQASNYQAMIPLTMTASHAFYINTEVLDDCGLQPAKTYAELKAQVAVLKAKGYETVIMPNKDTWVMQSCLFSAIAGRFCGEGWEKKILGGQAKFTDSDFVNALEFIQTLYRDGVIAPSSLGMDYGDGPGFFATNKGAYYIDGDWRIGAFITDASTGQALISPARQAAFRVTVFPDIEGAKLNKSTSVILGTGWAMSASIPEGSAKEDAAWRLIKWLTGNETQTLGVEHGAYSAAARTDVDVSKLNLEPLQKTAGNLGKEYTAGTVVIDGVFHSDVFTPINDGLQEIGLGTKTPAQVAAETQRVFDAGRADGKW